VEVTSKVDVAEHSRRNALLQQPIALSKSPLIQIVVYFIKGRLQTPLVGVFTMTIFFKTVKGFYSAFQVRSFDKIDGLPRCQCLRAYLAPILNRYRAETDLNTGLTSSTKESVSGIFIYV
jgi:hypothetical protein